MASPNLILGIALICQLCLVSSAADAKSTVQITLPGTGSDTDCSLEPNVTIPLQGLNLVVTTGLTQQQIGEINAQRTKMAKIHNGKHKYLEASALAFGCDVNDLAAVLAVESAGNGFDSNGRMIIRFENHVFYDRWATTAARQTQFNEHFDFRRDADRYTQHRFRADATGEWEECHSSQDQEWRVLQFAQGWDDTIGLESASYGVAQIMGFNHRSVGFADVQAMFTAFSSSIRAQMEGFFEFIRTHSECLEGLRDSDEVRFARCYNGNGKAVRYGAKIVDHALHYIYVRNRVLCSVDDALGRCYDAADSSQTCSGTAAAPNAFGCSNGFACCVVPVDMATGSWDGNTYGTCNAGAGRAGACIDTSRCAGTSYSNHCPGTPNSIKCCVKNTCLGNLNGGGGVGTGTPAASANNPITPPSNDENADSSGEEDTTNEDTTTEEEVVPTEPDADAQPQIPDAPPLDGGDDEEEVVSNFRQVRDASKEASPLRANKLRKLSFKA